MKSLLLLRHAKSGWKDSEMDDYDRPLNDRGIYDAPRMGAVLNAEKVNVDFILCSSAVRTRQTLALFLTNFAFEGDIHFDRELYHASKETIREHISHYAKGKENLLFVGHNPGIEEFLSSLVGKNLEMPTCALALIADAKKQDLHLSKASSVPLKMVEFWKPREI